MTHRFAHTHWCDDIRQEVDNKTTLIGIYTAGVTIAHARLPIVMPRLCAFTTMVTKLSNPFKRVSARVQSDDGKVISSIPEVDIPAPPDVDPEKDTLSLIFGIQMSPFPIAEGCRFVQVIVTADDEELAGPRLWIIQATAPDDATDES